jgi:hypothetical protein
MVAICEATGYYLYWFASVEIVITHLLVHVLGYDGDPEKVDILVSGMDARVKCERLKRASDRYKPLGPNLSELLEHFADKHIDLRNLISHSRPEIETGYHRPNGEALIHFSTLGKVYNPSKLPIRGRPLGIAAPSRPLREIYERAEWLRLFYFPLLRVFRVAGDLAVLEIDPATLSFPEAPPKPKKANPHAIPDRRARKAHRKTLRKSRVGSIED